jgi:hypothetical protein
MPGSSTAWRSREFHCSNSIERLKVRIRSWAAGEDHSPTQLVEQLAHRFQTAHVEMLGFVEDDEDFAAGELKAQIAHDAIAIAAGTGSTGQRDPLHDPRRSAVLRAIDAVSAPLVSLDHFGTVQLGDQAVDRECLLDSGRTVDHGRALLIQAFVEDLSPRGQVGGLVDLAHLSRLQIAYRMRVDELGDGGTQARVVGGDVLVPPSRKKRTAMPL